MAGRLSQRKIKRVSVEFWDGRDNHKGTSSDFSSSGIFIRTRKPLNPGALLKIVIVADEDRRINLMGVVARSIKTGVADFKNGMGVKLVSVSKEYEEFLKEVVRKD